jgi:serine/threonine-protein kinase
MMDDASELRLAQSFADILDGARGDGDVAELAAELETLAEIDRAIEPGALPERLSGLRIVAEVGSGGMGRVLLALDEALDRKVAIKTLGARYADHDVLRTRFMAEARAMARLSHPNIVRIYSLGPTGEPPHFVMEYLEGAPLTKAAAPLTFAQKAELMQKVALAVEFLHESGILHRDLKPANILVGADLEPKLLDFGLALDIEARERLSQIGEIAGTPEYLSPEQAAGVEKLDARSDVFSLGAVLYELLTGAPPFRGGTLPELLRRIREEDPALPRGLDAAVPKGLQDICLKALDKDPARRYASARDMAGDLGRFLAGEAVLAEPAAYTRLIAGKVGEHLSDLDGWRRDQVISSTEYEGLRKRYERLLEREDAWIMEARRLTLPQVSLYLGAWIFAVGAALLAFFHYPGMAGPLTVMVGWLAVAPMAWIGVRTWRRGYHRVAIAYLLALCLVIPVAALITMEEAGAFGSLAYSGVNLELFHRLGVEKRATNAQLWWALFAGLPVCWWLRRFTRTPVFSLVFSSMTALWCLTTLLRMGLLDWLDHDPGRFYFHLLPCAALFMAAGFGLERLGLSDDSRYFYPFAVAFTWAALSGVATFHEPYANWLKATAPWTRGQVEYLFIGNAIIYFALDRICERLPSAQAHLVGRAFRFVIPGHVLMSLFFLGLSARSHFEQRVFDWLLPAAACVFVFLSIPRQMKNFLASGLVFFAIGVFRLQQNVFPGHGGWPVMLLASGLALMIAAANYAPLRLAVVRMMRRVDVIHVLRGGK